MGYIKKILTILLMLSLFSGICCALELQRDKNVATIITFPICDADGDVVSGAAGLDSEVDAWADGSAPDGFADCTNEATEIGSTGIYYLSLTQTEMNTDYVYIQVKTTTSGAKIQHILINTRMKEAVDTAQADLDNPSQYQATGFSTHSAADVWSVGTRSLTDKANFTLASSEYTNIWNKDISGYSGTGYAGTYLKDLYDNQDWDVWDDAMRTLTAGTKDSEIDAIKAKTDDLNFNADATKLLLVDIRDVNDTAVAGVDDFKATGFSTHTAADVWSVATRSLTDKAGFSLSASGIDAIWDETITGHATADSFGKVFDDQIDGLRAYGDTNWITATGFSTHSAADIWSVGTRALTDKLGFSLTADQSGVTVGMVNALGAQAKTDVNTEIDTALTDIDLDHLTKIALPTGPSADIALGSVMGYIMDDGTAWSYDRSTDSLEAIAADGGGLTAQQVWEYATRSLTDKAGFSLSSSSEDSIVDKAWDEQQSGHTTAGTFGKYLDAQVSQVGGGTAADIADAVWDETITDHQGAGSTGKELYDIKNIVNVYDVGP